MVRLSLLLFSALSFSPVVLAAMGVSEITVVDILLVVGIPTAVVFLVTYPIIRSIKKVPQKAHGQEQAHSQERLASFIQSTASKEITHAEWQRYMGEPYNDTYMENARNECLHIVSTHKETPVISSVKQKELYQIKKNLGKISVSMRS